VWCPACREKTTTLPLSGSPTKTTSFPPATPAITTFNFAKSRLIARWPPPNRTGACAHSGKHAASSATDRNGFFNVSPSLTLRGGRRLFAARRSSVGSDRLSGFSAEFIVSITVMIRPRRAVMAATLGGRYETRAVVMQPTIVEHTQKNSRANRSHSKNVSAAAPTNCTSREVMSPARNSTTGSKPKRKSAAPRTKPSTSDLVEANRRSII
jgi:hypothetical protein